MHDINNSHSSSLNFTEAPEFPKWVPTDGDVPTAEDEACPVVPVPKPPASPGQNSRHPKGHTTTLVVNPRISYSTFARTMMAHARKLYDMNEVTACLYDEESGDARLLTSVLCDAVVYDHAEGTWYWYNDLHWEPDQTGNMVQLASDILSWLYSRLSTDKHAASIAAEKKLAAMTEQSEADLVALKRLQRDAMVAKKRAVELCHVREVERILVFARGGQRLGIAGDEWDQVRYVLPVANGIIDLHTAELLEPRPDQYIRTVAPVAWAGLDEPAPRFELFIQEIFASYPEIANYIQRLFGYSLTGTSAEHVFPILWGEGGRNGKDTLLNTIHSVLGPGLADAVSNDLVLEARGHTRGAATLHLMTLRGKRICWASEPSEGARITPGLVKQITGGGRIRGRELHKAEVAFEPTHLLLMLTNHPPHAPADDDALWERVQLIPFTERFVKKPDPTKSNEHPQDSTLKTKLQAESAGILAWLVRGCLDYQKNGLLPPDSVRLATEKYREAEDTIGIFLDECCLVQSSISCKAAELYSAYNKWCIQNNLPAMSGVKFGEKMAKRFTKRRGKGGVIYNGIGILDERV